MPHFHTLPDGRETGPEVVDPNDPGMHHHEIDGDSTSTDAFGEGHTHHFQGEDTSGPVDVDDEASKDKADEDDEDEDKDKNLDMNMELKFLGGHMIEVKQEERNGIPVGIIKGHIATWDLDRGLDRFIRGAFAESIANLKARGRPIRLKDHHGRTIGGFPIDKVVEDEKGLFGEGEINLTVQQGKEAFSLAKQGVLSDFSIGFSSVEDQMEDGIRIITKAIVWEGSIVDEPMNPSANITEVKQLVVANDVKEWTPRELERFLKSTGQMSKRAAKILASRIDKEDKQDYNENHETEDWSGVLAELKSIKL